MSHHTFRYLTTDLAGSQREVNYFSELSLFCFPLKCLKSKFFSAINCNVKTSNELFGTQANYHTYKAKVKR